MNLPIYIPTKMALLLLTEKKVLRFLLMSYFYFHLLTCISKGKYWNCEQFRISVFYENACSLGSPVSVEPSPGKWSVYVCLAWKKKFYKTEITLLGCYWNFVAKTSKLGLPLHIIDFTYFFNFLENGEQFWLNLAIYQCSIMWLLIFY